MIFRNGPEIARKSMTGRHFSSRSPVAKARNLLDNRRPISSMNTILARAPRVAKTVRTRPDWLAGLAFGLLWLEVIGRLRLEWSINPQYGYGWTVPFLAAFLFWRRAQRAPLASEPIALAWPIALILAAALFVLPVRLIQEANPDWRIMNWAIAGAAVVVSLGAVYLAGGARWLRHFAFPILFFLVAVPWPTQFEQLVIQGLMRVVASINVEVLNAVGVSAVQMGNVIEVGSGFVGIEEACTGVRSLQATLMVSLFLGELYDFTVARRLILILAGALLAFGCNLVRTFLLVWIGAEHGTNAIKSWHDPAGLTILLACLFGLWGVSMFMGGGRHPAAACLTSLNTGFRLPRALLIGISCLMLTAEAGTQLWYGIHEARAARIQPWNISWPHDAQNWKSVEVAEQAQELLRYNEGGGGAWSSEDGHAWTMYFFKWLPGRTAGLFIKNHRPDICLPASGMTLRGDVHHELVTINGVNLPIRAYVFENGASLLHVYYCYWDGSAPKSASQNQENWTAAGRLAAVRDGKRDVGTQMLEIVAADYADETEAEQAVRKQLAQIIHPG